MKQYKDVLRTTLLEGAREPNRTGIDTIKQPYPGIMRYHMDAGFPALTGRRAPFKSAMGELIGFIRGVTSAADFRDLGCKFWDQNANENAAWLANPFRRNPDELGDVYGAQWRRWQAFKMLRSDTISMDIRNKLKVEGWEAVADRAYHPQSEAQHTVFFKEVDQLADCVRKIILNPSDRRILFHAWNPATLDEIALPACHLLYQFVPTASRKELALSLTIR
jgi:thymidylate synthase